MKKIPDGQYAAIVGGCTTEFTLNNKTKVILTSKANGVRGFGIKDTVTVGGGLIKSKVLGEIKPEDVVVWKL